MVARSANIRRLSLAFVMVALMAASGCGGKEVKPTETDLPQGSQSTEPLSNPNGSSDQGNAGGLQTVHFPYDSFTLDSAAKNTIKGNGEVMKGKSSMKIQIEGHCDQRGGIQYNIALGEKRANAVRKYLVDQGIAGDRITTISFGKERPIDSGTDEAAYAKNRRANFVITQ